MDEEKEAKYKEKMSLLYMKSLELKNASEEGDSTCVEETTKIIQQADKAVKEAKRSNTGLLDAKILYNGGIIYKNLIEKMDSGSSEFEVKKYAENILNYLESNAQNENIWKALDEESALAFNNTGGWTWHLGAIDIDDAVEGRRLKRRKHEVVINVPARNPKKVQNLEKEEDDLEQHMDIIMSLLCKWEKTNKEAMQFWNLVLHPTSFSKTIENIFHVSHLIKECAVHLSLDRNGCPVIRVARKGQKNEKEKKSNRIPVAVNIDMNQWKELVYEFEIKRSMIPEKC